MTEKTCNRCGKTFEISTGFHPNPQMRDGYFNQCKECRRYDGRKNKVKYISRKKKQKRKPEPEPKYQRKCVTCGTPTNNYRCDECWQKLRQEEED